ncbi:hypothetical protein TNCV_3655381 [Trichonephila clavipes]|nr:hypothetical protein TNCV_3655381 [Trichonephila clavipes]
MVPNLLYLGKGLVLPTLKIDEVSEHARCLILSLPNNEMSQKSPFAIQKVIQGISGEPKSVKKLRSEAQKLIAPQKSQTYAQVTKTSNAMTTTQTDETITKIVCPPLKLLQPLIYVPKSTIFSSVPAITKSSTSTQAQLLPSTSSVTVTSSSKSQPPVPLVDTALAMSDSLSISAASSSSTACPILQTTTTSFNNIPPTSQDAKQTSKPVKNNVILKINVTL